ncbi:putative DNA topoisomerase, type IA, central region, subdomain 3 [Helianthus annuus]|nr:putative DNA topoisomerase, type IA, central region, subdomain 3 [Helianthus annuus]
MNVERTMQVAQDLYEVGFISYPRTRDNVCEVEEFDIKVSIFFIKLNHHSFFVQ